MSRMTRKVTLWLLVGLKKGSPITIDTKCRCGPPLLACRTKFASSIREQFTIS